MNLRSVTWPTTIDTMHHEAIFVAIRVSLKIRKPFNYIDVAGEAYMQHIPRLVT